MKDTIKEDSPQRLRVNMKAIIVLLSIALVSSLAIWGCSPKPSTDTSSSDGSKTEKTEKATDESGASAVDELATFSGFPTEGRFVDNVASLPGFYKNSEKNEANAKAEEPRRYTDRNGFLVQPVPSDPVSWNNTYLDADKRGCTSCHTLENALMSLPTYHRLIFFGYPTEQSYQNCIACHSDSYSGIKLADIIHTTHFKSTMFTDDDQGTCQSCHYLDPDTGEFDRWDEEKYNLYKGITDVTAKDAKAKITYDQTTITPAENRIFKTVKDEPSEWLTDDSKQDPSIYENWVISIDGDCENPVEMTLPELEKQFGTKKQVMKMDCTINGVGQAAIMQSEVEGIPLSAIIDYAKPKAGANVVSPIGSDGYDYAQMGIDWLL
ncbi:MAG: molybdopterin-dependent oxidoreductase, partial [Raoultibacter sp.]